MIISDYNNLIIASDGLKIVLGGILIFFAIGTIGVFLVYCLVRLIIFCVTARRNITHKLSQKQRSELEIILGFDPYQKLPTDQRDTYKNQVDKNQSAYARKIQECIREVGACEKAIAYYEDLKRRSEQRLVTLEVTLVELREILDTTNAVNKKIGQEIQSDSQKPSGVRLGSKKIKNLHKEEVANSATVIDVSNKIQQKKHELDLTSEAIEYLTSCIANERSKYDIRLSQIEQAHGEGGVDIQRVRAYNRASEILAQNPDLKKMLINVNVRHHESELLGQKLEEIEQEKNQIKFKVSEYYTQLDRVNTLTTEEISRQINALNKQALEFEEQKAELTIQRDQKNREVEEIRKSITEFLSVQKLSKADVLLAEDKVVGDIKYEAVIKRLNEKKQSAISKIEGLERKYQAIALKMSKGLGKRKNKKTIYEAELKNTVAELNDARIELKSVQDDIDYSLPNVSPLSVMRAGDGYVSKSWSGEDERFTVKDYRLAIAQIKNEYVKTVELGYADGSAKKQEILAKLDALEKIVSVEAVEEIAQPIALSSATSPEDRREKLRSIVIEMRNALKFVKSKEDAVALRRKVYDFGKTLTETDLSDPILSELIVRTMNDAKLLGEQAQYLNSKMLD